MALTAISPSPPSTNNNGNSPSVTSSDVVDVDYYRKGVKYLIDNSKDMKILPPEFVLPLPEAERPSLAICGSIPVIDLSGLNGTVEQRLSTIHAISSACAEWGFFRVIKLPFRLFSDLFLLLSDIALSYFISSYDHVLVYWHESKCFSNAQAINSTQPITFAYIVYFCPKNR